MKRKQPSKARFTLGGRLEFCAAMVNIDPRAAAATAISLSCDGNGGLCHSR